MNRRTFFLHTGLVAAASSIRFPALAAENEAIASAAKQCLLKPAPLKAGATIGLVAPGSPPSSDKMKKALESLTSLGYRVKEGANLHARNGFLAGTDAERVADLHWAFSDTSVQAVWCVRGGYGCGRLLPLIDYDLIRNNIKPLIGYSDITALHLAIGKKTGLVTFHGPVGTSDYTDTTLQHLRRVLVNPTPRYEIAAPSDTDVLEGEEYRPAVIRQGRASGPLLGGNLSLLSSLVGTDYCPSFAGKIVFIEEVGEQPYRIDRMLTQMLQGSDLSKANGIALGVFSDCKVKDKESSQTLLETLQDRLGALGIPVLYGLPFGHISNQATLPYGTVAELDTLRRTLTLTESSVLLAGEVNVVPRRNKFFGRRKG